MGEWFRAAAANREMMFRVSRMMSIRWGGYLAVGREEHPQGADAVIVVGGEGFGKPAGQMGCPDPAPVEHAGDGMPVHRDIAQLQGIVVLGLAVIGGGQAEPDQEIAVMIGQPGKLGIDARQVVEGIPPVLDAFQDADIEAIRAHQVRQIHHEQAPDIQAGFPDMIGIQRGGRLEANGAGAAAGDGDVFVCRGHVMRPHGGVSFRFPVKPAEDVWENRRAGTTRPIGWSHIHHNGVQAQ